MNILVTGANGQLGNEMRILAKDSKDTYIFTDVVEQEGVETIKLDITDLESIRKIVAENKVKVIVNCAAWTNVDAAEDSEKYELVEKLNATAPKNLAVAMKEVGGLLIHISTDYVFGGEPYNTPCKEDQQGTPTGVYGRTKLQGEQNIINVANNSRLTTHNSQLSTHNSEALGLSKNSQLSHVIIRTAWLYSEFGKNFVKTMLNLTATKPELKVVFDQVGTPTYAMDLAKAIVTILNDWKNEYLNQSSPFKGDREGQNFPPLRGTERVSYSKSGVYHYSNEGVCSWYDFTKMIQQISTELYAQKSPFKGRCERSIDCDDCQFIGTKECRRLSQEGPLIAECNVSPCYSTDFPSPVKRPSYSVLDKSKIKSVFGVEVPYWTDSLKVCINNLKNNQ